MINNVIGEKTIDLSYPIHSNKEIAVITMLSDNIQYQILKPHTIVDNISGDKKLIPSKTYAGRELLSMLEGMVAFTQFVHDERVIKMNKLKGITEMIINLSELDNTENNEDGRPSNALLTYRVTFNEDFTRFELATPRYKKLKNGEFTSLALRMMDQNGNAITDCPQVTVVLHIHDSACGAHRACKI